MTSEDIRKILNRRQFSNLQEISRLFLSQSERKKLLTGERGERGEKGDSYILTDEDIDEIIQTILGMIPIPKDGEDGKDGKDGRDGKNGRDGLNGINGKDGKNGKDGEDGKDGRDALEITAKEIVKKLRSLKGKERLNIMDINDPTRGLIDQRWHGGGMSTNKFISGEVISGSGTTWTLAHTPSLFIGLYAQGQRLSTARGDYTISGASITTTNTWSAGDLECDYYK